MGRPTSKVDRVVVAGPLAPFAEGFKARLEVLGYTPLSTVTWMRLMVHLSRWLGGHGLAAADLSSQRVEQYLRERQAAGYARFLSPRSVAVLLGFLSSMGVLAPEDAPWPCSEPEALLASFRDYLLKERGLAPSTAQAYVLRAHRFLDSRNPEVELVGLTVADVTRAVLGEAGTGSVGSTQFFVVALRAFLRFCFIHGLVPVDLSAAALTATGRRRPGLPKGLSRAEAMALLDSCDRRTSIGRRNYAVLLLLLRLGLRAGEVAALRLNELDWRAGEIVVHGKGQRIDRLPLPVDVGEAIAAYLRRGRPRSTHREVFLRTVAPLAALSRRGVSLIVQRACVRAGLAPVGAHRLRHTLACDMVRAGVPARDQPGATSSQLGQHRHLRASGCGPAPDAGPAVAERGGGSMNEFDRHVRDYLKMRRALGFKLRREGQVLAQLAAYLERAGAEHLNTELALRWAQLPQNVAPINWAHRLGAARGFAAYLKTIDPATEIPPRGLFPATAPRPTPYLWSAEDVARLVRATGQLRPLLLAATYEALFGLIAASGIRLGEAIALDRDDVDLAEGLLTIREAKFGHTRLVPLHPTVAEALGGYAERRDRLGPQPRSHTFFVSSVGTALLHNGVHHTFNQLTTDLGLRTATVRPRVHDLRHSFAVRTLIDWHRAGLDIDSRMPVLSTYLGHVNPAGTYWYLSASPELMALAAARLNDRYGARR